MGTEGQGVFTQAGEAPYFVAPSPRYLYTANGARATLLGSAAYAFQPEPISVEPPSVHIGTSPFSDGRRQLCFALRCLLARLEAAQAAAQEPPNVTEPPKATARALRLYSGLKKQVPALFATPKPPLFWAQHHWGRLPVVPIAEALPATFPSNERDLT